MFLKTLNTKRTRTKLFDYDWVYFDATWNLLRRLWTRDRCSKSKFWRKALTPFIQNAGPSLSAFSGKPQSAALHLFVCVSMLTRSLYLRDTFLNIFYELRRQVFEHCILGNNFIFSRVGLILSRPHLHTIITMVRLVQTWIIACQNLRIFERRRNFY